MKLSPRAKLLLLMALFALPIAASVITYLFVRPAPTANYGELILPPQPISTQTFGRIPGGTFRFAELADRWVLVVSDSGQCDAACREKLVIVRQVRLALGRNASRVERVFVVDDTHRPGDAAFGDFPGMIVALTPTAMPLPTGAVNDRAHVYLVDPHGNVMLRWRRPVDPKRMLKDLERLLKASQIG